MVGALPCAYNSPMTRVMTFLMGALGALAVATPAQAKTPFGAGTVFITSELITPADPTALTGLTFIGRRSTEIFDFRNDGNVRRKVWTFTATYSDGRTVTSRVNPEFNQRKAKAQSLKYARIIGQLPAGLRAGIFTLTINRGDFAPAADEAGDVTISTDGALDYQRDGQLEEAIAHESGHATLDKVILHTDEWKAAQAADPTYLSDYARKHPNSEDLAETLVPWLIARFRPESVRPAVVRTIEQSVPNRLAVLDAAGIDMTGWLQ